MRQTAPPPKAAALSWSFLTEARFTLKDQIFFAKRLSFLTKAGVPIMEALSLIRSQTSGKKKAEVYGRIIEDVANGHPLSSSIGKFPRFLSDFGVNVIKVGESTGILEENLAYLADELDKKDSLRKKIIGAMIYPAFITVSTLGVAALLTVYIFPKIMPIFLSLHVPLPLTTRILIGVSAYLRHWGILTFIALLLLAGIFAYLRVRSEQVRLVSDRFLLALPLSGDIARSYNLANFCRTTSLMLRSGIPIESVIRIVAETTPNRLYRRAYAMAAEGIAHGEPLSIQLEQDPWLFPSTVTHMVAVGERSGSLSTTFGYLAELYEQDVDDRTKNLSSSIEPVLMAVMGLLVGLIAVSVITPIYGITQHLTPR
ncbi:MAG: type II secretion system F family protein [Bacillota bacterium]